jgi:hypothetical protein
VSRERPGGAHLRGRVVRRSRCAEPSRAGSTLAGGSPFPGELIVLPDPAAAEASHGGVPARRDGRDACSGAPALYVHGAKCASGGPARVRGARRGAPDHGRSPPPPAQAGSHETLVRWIHPPGSRTDHGAGPGHSHDRTRGLLRCPERQQPRAVARRPPSALPGADRPSGVERSDQPHLVDRPGDGASPAAQHGRDQLHEPELDTRRPARLLQHGARRRAWGALHQLSRARG